jgi:hypothetical protein
MNAGEFAALAAAINVATVARREFRVVTLTSNAGHLFCETPRNAHT